MRSHGCPRRTPLSTNATCPLEKTEKRAAGTARWAAGRGVVGGPQRSPLKLDLPILRKLLLLMGTGGNLTSDAHLAALAIEHGAELCSSDTDFARFQGLRWSNPLA